MPRCGAHDALLEPEPAGTWGARGSPPRQRGLNVLGLWRLAGAFTIPIGDLFLDVEGRPIP